MCVCVCLCTCVCVCECVSDACQSYHCQLKKHIEWGRETEQKCSVSMDFCHMRICMRLYSLSAVECACGCNFKFHCYAGVIICPLIYAFMKESPVGLLGLLLKLLCLKQGAEKSDRQKHKNGGLITDNHVMA